MDEKMLILKSMNGLILTDKLINSWLDANEMFITKKIFSNDRYSVVLIFTDEERAEMICDLLTTCYSDYISVERPQISIQSSLDDERVLSPIHLSSTSSISSRVSCFSQRLAASDKIKTDDQMSSAIGRGRGIDGNFIQMNMSTKQELNNNDDRTMIHNSRDISSTSSLPNNRKFYFDNEN